MLLTLMLIRYPGMYQPLQATAIILADLIKNPNTDEALRSRTVVDRLFSLIGPDGFGSQTDPRSKRNLSPAGQEAWQMLRSLRKQAWRAAGLDPDFVWTDFSRALAPEQQVQHSTNSDVGRRESDPTVTERPDSKVFDSTFTPEWCQTFDPTWSESLDFSNFSSDQSGQFGLSNIEGFDWQLWDLILQQSFNMPKPDQPWF
jgi:hypothetical protein